MSISTNSKSQMSDINSAMNRTMLQNHTVRRLKIKTSVTYQSAILEHRKVLEHAPYDGRPDKHIFNLRRLMHALDYKK